MIKRARHRFTVDSLDEEGAGAGTPAGLGGRRLHVPFALPGEEVIAEVEHESPHRAEAWGRLLEVLRPAAERVEPACAAWGRCGGCAVQHLGYPHQLAWKRSLVQSALRGAGLEAAVAPCVAPLPEASPAGEGSAARPYRNRSKLVFARDGQRILLGAYAPRSHRVIDLAGCAVVIPPLDEVAGTIARIATAAAVRPYDERSASGEARYALLRAGPTGATQVMLVVARRGGRGVEELARRLMAERPEVRGVVENLQPSRGNALVGDVEPDLVLAGEPDLVERVAGVPLRISPRAFFQASWPGAEVLYRRAVEAAGLQNDEQAIDLYCGVGGIALAAALATPGAGVLGVEEIGDAARDAEAARALAGIANARFTCAEVRRFLDEHAARRRADVVFVDPPRRGLAPGVIDGIARLAPRRVVYVSCAPDTLARDLALFAARGYRACEVTPIDLMPDTAHVEALCALDRA